ncbi:hypothetical protein OQJ13_14355 [Legionella sp. PATHC035]|uniref:hypothetical protein n=1 Tax=Legionella sp. PATHC035 TaxID=2992040 RepID=UPI002244D7F5|nr:hypothetical protein [Legionella sp. PATHC035]MCW8410158.1 hypothetical protein [Legionella sp. PATHC035]
MPLITLYELESTYYPKFIQALRRDMKTSSYSDQVNHQVLSVAIGLLSEPGKYTALSLEHIMIGTLNMAIVLQISKYGSIAPENIGENLYNNYVRESTCWFMGYNKALKNIKELSDEDALRLAIPVIERAAKGCLYITPCFPHTLNLFFEYCMQLHKDFIPPALPTGNTFHKWNQNQFLSFNTSYSSSLLSQSLFAVKANRLPIEHLPSDLQNELNLLVEEDDVGDVDDANTTSHSCCTIS